MDTYQTTLSLSLFERLPQTRSRLPLFEARCVLSRLTTSWFSRGEYHGDHAPRYDA